MVVYGKLMPLEGTWEPGINKKVYFIAGGMPKYIKNTVLWGYDLNLLAVAGNIHAGNSSGVLPSFKHRFSPGQRSSLITCWCHWRRVFCFLGISPRIMASALAAGNPR
jgi:hypothetical protein